MSRRAALWLVLVGGLVGAVGCGGSAGREAVSGSVQFRSQPLDQGTIEFHPQDAETAGSFEGAAITNGRYELPAKKGLLPGKYKVVVSSSDAKAKEDPVPGESGPLAKERIPARYNTASAEVVEVKRGGPNVFDYDIK